MERTMLVTASLLSAFSLAIDAFCIHGLWARPTMLWAHTDSRPRFLDEFENYEDQYLQGIDQDNFYDVLKGYRSLRGRGKEKFPRPDVVHEGGLCVRFDDGTSIEDPARRQQIPDEELVQTLSEPERIENLRVLRSLKNNVLPRFYDPSTGLRREEVLQEFFDCWYKDPWFGVNQRMIDVLEWGAPPETMEYLRGLAEKLGGPPPGVILSGEGVAYDPHVFDAPLSPAAEFEFLQRTVMKYKAERSKKFSRRRKWNPHMPDESDIDKKINLALRDAHLSSNHWVDHAVELEMKHDLVRDALGYDPYVPSSGELYEMEEQNAIDYVLESFQIWKQWKRGNEFGINDTETQSDSPYGEEEADRVMDFVQRPDYYSLDKDEDEDEDLNPDMQSRLANLGKSELIGDMDMCLGKFNESAEPYSSCTTGPLTVEVFSEYDQNQTGPPVHHWVYTVSITNNSPTNTTKLTGRRFEVQTIGSEKKRVIELAGVTGFNPVIKPGEVFEYSSKAPLELEHFGDSNVAARLQGHYYYETWDATKDVAMAERGLDQKGEAKIAPLHLLFPPIDEESSTHKFALAMETPETPREIVPMKLIPGDEDMMKGEFDGRLNGSSTVVTGTIMVAANSSYVPEKSNPAEGKHCFAYHVSITNRGSSVIELTGRRFEVQTVLQSRKNVIERDGVTGFKPMIAPGATFTYSSLAPLEVDSALGDTKVVGRMQGEYHYKKLDDDWNTTKASAPKSAKLGVFHFVLPDDTDRQEEN